MNPSILELKQLAAENLGRSLQRLSEILDKQKTQNINLLLSFQSRLRRLTTNKLEGILSQEDAETFLNRLTHDVLEFLDSLSDSDFSLLAQLKEEIYDKILVVCYGEGAVLELQPFFDSFYFKNVQYALYDFDEDKIIWADLIVFDYVYAVNNDPDYYELLKQYLDETPGKYLLHFGSYNKILDYYPMKVHIAHSPFELYARIREMIEFKKFYKGTK